MPIIKIRLRDTTKHIFMPIKISCLIFCVATALTGAYVMYFLPAIPRYILMALHVGIGLFGLCAIYFGKPALNDWYRIVMTPLTIPIIVVLCFITYIMSLPDMDDCSAVHNGYICFLYDMNFAFLASGECVAILWNLFASLNLLGFWKLRWYQTGVTRLRYPEDPLPTSNIPTAPTYPTPSAYPTASPADQKQLIRPIKQSLWDSAMVNLHVTDTRTHFFMPTKVACYIAVIVATLGSDYVFYFLPYIANYIVMGICFLIGVFGIAVIFLGKPQLTSIYGMVQPLTIIIVLGVFVIDVFVMVIYAQDPCTYGGYICGLQEKSAGMIVSCNLVALFVFANQMFISIAFRKLQMYQKGIYHMAFPPDSLQRGMGVVPGQNTMRLEELQRQPIPSLA